MLGVWCFFGAWSLVLGASDGLSDEGYGPPTSLPPNFSITPPSARPRTNWIDQSQAAADAKSSGCIQCHAGVEPMQGAGCDHRVAQRRILLGAPVAPGDALGCRKRGDLPHPFDQSTMRNAGWRVHRRGERGKRFAVHGVTAKDSRNETGPKTLARMPCSPKVHRSMPGSRFVLFARTRAHPRPRRTGAGDNHAPTIASATAT